MMTIICIMILAYGIMGKDISALLKRVKNVDWHGKANELYAKLQPYARKAGRVATRPLLQFYYVMIDANTSTLERILVYAGIIYTISPVSLIPSAVFKLLGILDEGVAILYVYDKIKSKLTPEINERVEQTLNHWFAEYTPYELVEVEER